jgi:hypothetical protein
MSVTAAGEGECRRDGFDMCLDDFAFGGDLGTRSTRLPVWWLSCGASVPDLGVFVELDT